MAKIIYTNQADRYFLVEDSETKERVRYYFDECGILAGFTRDKLEQTLVEEGCTFVWA